MKAAMFYGKEDVRVEEIEEPRVRPGTVKIAPAWNGICGSDLHLYHDGPIPPAPTASKPHPISGETLPVVLGHEFSGVVEAIGGLFAVYIVMFFIFMALAMMDGMDQVTAFGTVAATISNLGPGLGEVAITFADVSAHGKIMFAVAMLFGRLEIYTFLVLLTPAFWRR